MNPEDHSPGFLAVVNEARKQIREIDIERFREMRAKQERFLLIDVREDDEFSAAHAEGAKHLGKGIIERDIEKEIPDKNAALLLYCGGGVSVRFSGRFGAKDGLPERHVSGRRMASLRSVRTSRGTTEISTGSVRLFGPRPTHTS